MFPSSHLKAEISNNGDASWARIYDVKGNNSAGSSAEWKNSRLSISRVIPMPYVGKLIRLRFRIETTGQYFQWISANTIEYDGVYLDDISITSATDVINEYLTLFDEEAMGCCLQQCRGWWLSGRW